MTTTATRTCDYAACHQPATNTAGQWAFCATHAEEDQRLRAEEQASVYKPPAFPTTVTTPAPLGSIARLLEDASGHGQARIRKLAERIEALLDRLRADMAASAEQERARLAQAKADEAAQAEVARLEAELRTAKAKLRGRGTAKPGRTPSSSWTPERRAAQAERIRATNAARAQRPKKTDIDPVAVELACSGQRDPKDLTVAERREVVRTMHGRGLPDTEIADITRFNIRTVLRIRQELDLPAIESAA